jgi:hypothetical protein
VFCAARMALNSLTTADAACQLPNVGKHARRLTSALGHLAQPLLPSRRSALLLPLDARLT